MAYDKRYNEDEVVQFVHKGRRQALAFVLVVYFALRYFTPELLKLIP